MAQTYIKQLIFSWLRMVHREITENGNREHSAFPICLSRVASVLNPCLNRKHEVVASCCISNCIEFGTIKKRIIQLFPFTEVFYCTFEAHPSENNMLLHLAMCHIGQRDIILILNINNRYFCIFNFYLCHIPQFLDNPNQWLHIDNHHDLYSINIFYRHFIAFSKGNRKF